MIGHGTNANVKKQQFAMDIMDEVNDETDRAELGLRAITTDFKENTTAHGIPHVYHAKGTLKVIFWTIISLGATAGLIWNGYILVAKYIAFNVSVSVKIESDRSLTFPAVTVCNHNPIKLMKLGQNSELNALKDAFQTGKRKKRDLSAYGGAKHGGGEHHRVKRQAGPGQREGQSQNARFEFLQSITDTVADLPVEDKMDLGYELQAMILDCEFNGYDCNFTTDFHQFYDATYGNCFTYNWGKQLGYTETSYRPGASHGLSLTYNVDQDQYVGALAEAAGLRVVVHPQSNMPFPSDEGISVAPGALTYVGVRKLEVSRLGGIYGDCYTPDTNDYDINVYSEIFGVSYTAKACYLTCFQKALIKHCGCGDGSYPLYGQAFGYQNVTACKTTNTTQMDCEDDIFTQYNDGTLGCVCTEACEQTGYEYGSSTVLWPSDANTASVRSEYIGNPSVKHLFMNDSTAYKANMGKVVVYFEEFNYQSISESPAYDIGSLISDTGGILGLYLGFSALTILEFFELAGDLLVWCCIAGCRKKKNRTPVEPIKSMPAYYNNGLNSVSTQA